MSHGKILCLHGFTQSGPLFAAKTAGLRKAFAKAGFETHYLSAPLKLTPADLPFDAVSLGSVQKAETPDYRSWWLLDDDYDMTEAWKSIRECVEKEGPFVGIMGFSQGAGFAGVVANKLAEFSTQTDALKFAILYSGFRLKPARYQKYYEPKLALPTLHVWGELDTVVEEDRSRGLWDVCEDSSRTLLKHPGGHFVPNSKMVVSQVVGWSLNVVAPNAYADKMEQKPEKRGDDFSQDLLDAIDGLGKL
ncbi:hypothetical protein BABINDRAFT_160999 [Babjeviella inositovora NRRL Y-12698]|uniref:Serine hydrolase domain-containing protein n=1 Tax=Babjeviella inositovora NRRL Y-12698 TaxID=984486 RepID=A0A1E3QV05_9ASCO|nr:uncharacterized protein BABINDRAFT_160999 [Babjeviella inositovora NRRL Y-12698]ODQ80787.1 hypothetical protein BABINDRAFT_160999 [Babjeviella inositovora NRRL Y-12698]